jgi:hypothetical protein
MTSQDSNKHPQQMTEEELNEFLNSFWDDVRKEADATDDDYFDPQDWEAK